MSDTHDIVEPETDSSATEEPVEATVTEHPAEQRDAVTEAPEAEVTGEVTPAEVTEPREVEDTGGAEDAGASAAPVPAPPMPSPAMFARSLPTSASAAYGRVDDDGVVYVRTADGEKEVGSYPGASRGEALAYFARKYDELAATVELLHQRVTQTDVAAKEAADSLGKLREQVAEARVVGDLPALDERLAQIEAAITERREHEQAARAQAKAAATARREELVAEAEKIAGQPEHKIQWKSSGARMRELLEEWKTQQRTGPRLDKDVESALWQRLSASRNGFDKARKVHFAQLDSEHSEAKATKERLVAEAERLASSRDWAATAGAFKRLMDDWRRAGRAGRSDDDALWARFKGAQDTFFAAKDEVVAAEEQVFSANLVVKQGLIAEAEALLPVQNLDAAKAALRVIQEKWDKAGKVPRADLERTEKALRRVEQAVRDAEDKRWASSNPEVTARASSFVDQLEKAVAGLERDLEAAQATGNAKKVAEATAALEARKQWLAQARQLGG